MNCRLLLAVVFAGTATSVATAQTQIDLRTQSKRIDFSAAPVTRPVKVGTSLPTFCTTGDLFFKSNATPGSNLYACTADNIWTLQSAGQQSQTGLPLPTGNANKLLVSDGTSAIWRSVTSGASGALQLTQSASEISLDIVTEVIPRKSAANIFTGLNTFDQGIQLTPQSTPAMLTDGRIWYDSEAKRFRVRENGSTVNLTGSGATSAASYITRTPDPSLTNSQALSTLSTGLLKNASGSGVLSIATAGTDYYAPGTQIRPEDLPPIDAGASKSAAFITKTPDPTLTNAQALSSLPSGLLKNSTGTGTLSTATPGTDYYAPGTPINPQDLPTIESGASKNAAFITKTPDPTLTNSQALSALPSGLLKNSAGTGELSTATAGTDYYAPGNQIHSEDLPLMGDQMIITNARPGLNVNNITLWGAVRVQAVPVYGRMVVSKGWVHVSTVSSGATAYFGIYDSNRNAVCRASAPSPSSPGIVTGDCIEGPVVLNPGVYYLAVSSESNMALMGTAASTPLVSMLNSGATMWAGIAQNSVSNGVLPESLGAISFVNNVIFAGFGQ